MSVLMTELAFILTVHGAVDISALHLLNIVVMHIFPKLIEHGCMAVLFCFMHRDANAFVCIRQPAI